MYKTSLSGVTQSDNIRYFVIYLKMLDALFSAEHQKVKTCDAKVMEVVFLNITKGESKAYSQVPYNIAR